MNELMNEKICSMNFTNVLPETYPKKENLFILDLKLLPFLLNKCSQFFQFCFHQFHAEKELFSS